MMDVMKLLEDGVRYVDYPQFLFRGIGSHQAVCRLRMRWKGDVGLACWTELPNNTGTSVTNAAENLAAQVVSEFELHPEKCLFIEHYPGDKVLGQAERYDIVHLEWYRMDNNIWRAKIPTWEHLPLVEARLLIAKLEGAPDGKATA